MHVVDFFDEIMKLHDHVYWEAEEKSRGT